MRPRAALALIALVVSACPERRRPIALRTDAGPSVVVVDRRPAGGRPPVIDEVEPNDDRKAAQPLPAGKGVRGTIGPDHLVKGKLLGDEDVYVYTAPSVPGAPLAPNTPLDAGAAIAPVLGPSVRVDLSGVPGLDLQLEALDERGRRLVMVNDGKEGEDEAILALGVEPGRPVYLRVRAVPRATDRRGAAQAVPAPSPRSDGPARTAKPGKGGATRPVAETETGCGFHSRCRRRRPITLRRPPPASSSAPSMEWRWV
jgi:hypothetical protein